MQDHQALGAYSQIPPHWGNLSRRTQSVGLLHNRNVQIPFSDKVELPDTLLPTSQHSSKLEELKKRRFTDEGKDERIARSLAALNQQTSIHLSPEEWKLIAEDPDIEDQF